MRSIELRYAKIQVVRVTGTDIIKIEFDGPTPFPELAAQAGPDESYAPTLNLECRRGYAEEWLRLMGISSYELITPNGSQQVRPNPINV